MLANGSVRVDSVLASDSWQRWAFFMNLPTLGVAAAILLSVLKVEAPQKLSLREWARTFDFTGLFCASSAL